MTTQPKLFAAERQFLERQKASGAPGKHQTLDEIHNGIKLILEHLNLAAAPKEEAAPTPSQDEAFEHEMQMRTELRALSVCIAQTKAEIAAIQPVGVGSDTTHLKVVSNELDAVVQSTEVATGVILDNVELAEGLVMELKSHVTGYAEGLVHDISDKMTKILEACNFQDVTGQRITKVVKTMKYLEERINAMIDIWGEEDLAHVHKNDHDPKHDPDMDLLNGPQLPGAGCNQNDIDAMFG